MAAHICYGGKIYKFRHGGQDWVIEDTVWAGFVPLNKDYRGLKRFSAKKFQAAADCLKSFSPARRQQLEV